MHITYLYELALQPTPAICTVQRRKIHIDIAV